MQNLLDKMVEVKTNEGVMVGKLYDYTTDGKTVWVETEEDIFLVNNFESINEVKEETEETEHPIFAELDKLGYDYDVFYDDEGFDILVSGITYTVSIQQDKDGYYCFTTHRERYKKEEEELYGDTNKADGNKRKIKKLETVIRYVEKWADK